MPRLRWFLVCTVVALSQAASAANTLTADEAKNHIGETATVCGVIAGTHYAARTRGSLSRKVDYAPPVPSSFACLTGRAIGRTKRAHI